MNWDSLLSSPKQIYHLDYGMFSLTKSSDDILDMLRSLHMVWHLNLIGDLSEEVAGSFWWSSRCRLRCR